MATETSGDSNATKSSTTTNKGFCFRPSALSDVADKMWKKSGTETNASSSNTGNAPNLFQLPALSSLSSSTSAGTNSLFTSSSTSSSPFIFGKNISNRVANAAETDGDSSASSKKETEAPKSEDGSKEKLDSENGKSERTGVSFDTLAATSTTTDSAVDSSNGTASASSTSETAGAISEDAAAAALEASAAAYEAAKHQTLKQPALLAPEEVKTGEEGEVNVLHAAVKLYVFDAGKQSWTDRGLAIIRVNDRRVTNEDGENLETRIVVRLQGSLRVIVNTKIWPEMLLERVAQKRLRLSGTVALEENESETAPAISIYLISAGQAADVDRIERLLRDRLARLKEIEHRPNSAAGKKRPFPQPDESSWSNESDQGESSAKKRVDEEENEDK